MYTYTDIYIYIYTHTHTHTHIGFMADTDARDTLTTDVTRGGFCGIEAHESCTEFQSSLLVRRKMKRMTCGSS